MVSPHLLSPPDSTTFTLDKLPATNATAPWQIYPPSPTSSSPGSSLPTGILLPPLAGTGHWHSTQKTSYLDLELDPYANSQTQRMQHPHHWDAAQQQSDYHPHSYPPPHTFNHQPDQHYYAPPPVLNRSVSEDSSFSATATANVDVLSSSAGADPQETSLVIASDLLEQSLKADGRPKRPMNAFLIYARHRRPEIGKAQPQLKTGEISGILSAEWKNMDAPQKSLWRDQAKVLRDAFNERFPDYVYERSANGTRKHGSRGGKVPPGRTVAGSGPATGKRTSESATPSSSTIPLAAEVTPASPPHPPAWQPWNLAPIHPQQGPEYQHYQAYSQPYDHHPHSHAQSHHGHGGGSGSHYHPYTRPYSPDRFHPAHDYAHGQQGH